MVVSASGYLIEVTQSWVIVFSLIVLINVTGLGVFLIFGDARRVDLDGYRKTDVSWPRVSNTSPYLIARLDITIRSVSTVSRININLDSFFAETGCQQSKKNYKHIKVTERNNAVLNGCYYKCLDEGKSVMVILRGGNTAHLLSWKWRKLNVVHKFLLCLMWVTLENSLLNVTTWCKCLWVFDLFYGESLTCSQKCLH